MTNQEERFADLSVNRFEALGKMITSGRSVYGHTEITLTVQQQRRTIRKDDDRDPSVLLFIHFALSEPLSPSLKMGDLVKVTGYLKGYRYHNEATDRWRNVQYLVADKVVPAETILKDKLGIAGHFYEKQYFNLYLIGEYEGKVREGDRWSTFRIRTKGIGERERYNDIIASFYEKSKYLSLARFEAGQKVACYFHIYTPEKEIAGEKVHFENFVLEDIVSAEALFRENDIEERERDLVQNGFLED